MKKKLLLVPALIVLLNLLPAGRATAQTFTTLHSFAGGGGASPTGVILLGNTLYGTAPGGGSLSSGKVFAINTDGTGFTILHSFTEAPYRHSVNSDGAYPTSGLIILGDTLYGTALQGGSADGGTVFTVNTDGTGFTTLHSFTAPYYPYNSDGSLSACRIDFIGKHPVWDGDFWRQRGQWHGVQSFVPAATDHHTFRALPHFVVAYQCCRVRLHRLHFAKGTHHHRLVRRRSRLDESLHHSHRQRAAVFPVKPVIKRITA
jgi:uncharacterized repeat protein (TIGR03803 family)